MLQQWKLSEGNEPVAPHPRVAAHEGEQDAAADEHAGAAGLDNEQVLPHVRADEEGGEEPGRHEDARARRAPVEAHEGQQEGLHDAEGQLQVQDRGAHALVQIGLQLLHRRRVFDLVDDQREAVLERVLHPHAALGMHRPAGSDRHQDAGHADQERHVVADAPAQGAEAVEQEEAGAGDRDGGDVGQEEVGPQAVENAKEGQQERNDQVRGAPDLAAPEEVPAAPPEELLLLGLILEAIDAPERSAFVSEDLAGPLQRCGHLDDWGQRTPTMNRLGHQYTHPPAQGCIEREEASAFSSPGR